MNAYLTRQAASNGNGSAVSAEIQRQTPALTLSAFDAIDKAIIMPGRVPSNKIQVFEHAAVHSALGRALYRPTVAAILHSQPDRLNQLGFGI
jgi:hypothetical protein